VPESLQGSRKAAALRPILGFHAGKDAMLVAGELGLTIACFVIAITMVWYGRRNSYRLSQNGFVFVTYPVLVLVFIVMGAATMLNALLGRT
jgi:hypothetical protein